MAVLALSFSILSPALSGQRYRTVTLRFADKESDDSRNSVLIDVGKKGLSAGDYAAVKGDVLYNRALTRRVGAIRGQQMLVRVTDEAITAESDFTFQLPRGSITVEGTGTTAEPIETLAVTGGTGRFKAAHGHLRIDHSRAAGALYTFVLLL